MQLVITCWLIALAAFLAGWAVGHDKGYAKARRKYNPPPSEAARKYSGNVRY
jgi:hypothetical protein